MNKIEWDTENGVLDENDLWKLFSDHPDQPSETIQFFSEIKPLLKNMRFRDETRLYHVYHHPGGFPDPPVGARFRATVTQRNLRQVAAAIAGRGNNDAAIQYLGLSGVVAACPTPALVKAPHRQSPMSKPKSASPSKRDSVDKIVTSYFATLTAEPFQYKGKEFLPRDVYVSPGIVRGYTCPPMCGGCCPRFSLDYIVPDNLPAGEKYLLTPRMVEFNGRHVEVWSDKQKDHDSTKCRNLNWEDGRCGIHGNQPFSCDFELLRSLTYKDSNRSDFTQKLYGRGWAMTRVDGQKKALCEMTPPTRDTIADVARRLGRLETWMLHFGLNPSRVGMIRSRLDEISASGDGFWIT